MSLATQRTAGSTARTAALAPAGPRLRGGAPFGAGPCPPAALPAPRRAAQQLQQQRQQQRMATAARAAAVDAPAPPSLPYRVGHGFDLHRLAEGYKLVIGGVEIPHTKGCEAHSDGDVLLHTVTDAILGALSLPDIGQLFPDNDPTWKGAASDIFVKEAVKKMRAAGYVLGNLDATIIAQKPKLSPHKENIRANLCALLGAHPSVINIKAKTHEKVDSIGEERSIGCHAAERRGRRAALAALLLLCLGAAAAQQPAAAAQQPAAAPGPAPAAPAPAKAGKKSQIVSIAPEADVANDVDDIDAAGGACKAFLTSSACRDVEPGEGAVAECISDTINAAEAGDNQDAESVPEECQEEVYQFMITRGKNINANIPLAKACKDDALKLCNNSWLIGAPQDGRVINCLRDRKSELSKPCAKQVFKVQKAIASDYRADPSMALACKPDVERLCGTIKSGSGRVNSCLVRGGRWQRGRGAAAEAQRAARADRADRAARPVAQRQNRPSLSWECAEEVFRQQLEADDDIRLNVRLFQKCLADKKRFCADVQPGNAAARDCLVEHRNDRAFTPACRDELEGMIEARVRDFRIDSRLRRVCEAPILELCGGMDSYESDETDMNICLQDSVDLIPPGPCKAMVYEYQKLAAQDIRFDVPLADACHEDRKTFCANVPPGSARVIRCLHNNREKLSGLCRATLFDEEVRFSENIDFQYPMKQACLGEIERFCKDIPHGNARVIRCLQENKGAKDFGRPCLKEVAAYEQGSAQDYRLNFRLRKACDKDISKLCKDVCSPKQDQVCGGTVLRCLTEHLDELASEGCRKEVHYFEKMEVSNYNNDVLLAVQCRGDVERFCKDVEPGEGRVHACLRGHRKELSDGCRREEMILEQQEAEHIELRPNLLKACSDERTTFCANVKPGSARVFRCLAEKLADPDFGAKCRYEVVAKLQRRQANWKLDPPLRRACRADVADMCKAEDGAATETGEVYRCLIHNHDDLDPGCKRELGRAVHMAFFVWTPGAILTRECDADVAALCLKDRPNMDRTPGAVGGCLADLLERLAAAEGTSRKMVKEPAGSPAAPPALGEACRVLADVAEPPNMKRAFDTTLSVALLESQLSALESKTGLPLLARDRRGRRAA
ncbi:hypothetical protein HT031_001987 [Scenedesmus sp. PABB004]|nr:hypothetical protein HT031_001987 [Scenedesmus sp. PABB004]